MRNSFGALITYQKDDMELVWQTMNEMKPVTLECVDLRKSGARV